MSERFVLSIYYSKIAFFVKYQLWWTNMVLKFVRGPTKKYEHFFNIYLVSKGWKMGYLTIWTILNQRNPIIIMFYMYYRTHITTKSHNLSKVSNNLNEKGKLFLYFKELFRI